jgi:hypothetical protein
MRRRDVLGAGIAAIGWGFPAWAGAADQGEGALRFHLNETAGLRRFGYPVHTVLPSAADRTVFRLERAGKPVPAQFRRVTGPDGKPAVVLDFNASPGPLEAEEYTVRFGPGVEPGPEPRGGMKVEHVDDRFDVTNGSVLAYRVPDHLAGFLRSVRNARVDFLREGSPGFSLATKDGRTTTVGSAGGGDEPGFRGTVTRQGPLAVGLRFEGSSRFDGEGEVKSTVDMTFPSSKSWVEVRWAVDDPGGVVSALGVDLDLTIEGAPVVLDFGASDTVYGYLRPNEAMRLLAGAAPGLPPPATAWQVEKLTGATVSSFATAPIRGAVRAEGWAHVMDKTRCTAVAVADFGRPAARDAIQSDESGRLKILRAYAGPGTAAPKGLKSLKFWLHFVTNPVQFGAVTSPQAMLAPLVVEWESKPPGP